MHDVANWRHSHNFQLSDQRQSERRVWWVIGLTAVTMVVELIVGFWSGSMALLADGWHMATHVGALGITVFAYGIARRHAQDPRFTFGTGKVATLGGYTSAIMLGIVALLMAGESISRLISPQEVHFEEAMMVAWLGLLVNLASAWMLKDSHSHSHSHGDHDHAHHHGPKDHNLQAAYWHVLADALTSVLAIIALWAGSNLGWVWMDPLMGIVGSVVIARWAYVLLQDSGRVLLDAENNTDIENKVKAKIEEDGESRIADLHIWRVGPQSFACIVSLVTHNPRPLSYYKETLSAVTTLDHVTVELLLCEKDTCRYE